MTSAIDRAAIQAAAASMVGQREGEQVAGRFAALLKAEPFPPSEPGGTSVEEWRVRLWERAIGVRPPSVSAARTPTARADAQQPTPRRMVDALSSVGHVPSGRVFAAGASHPTPWATRHSSHPPASQAAVPFRLMAQAAADGGSVTSETLARGAYEAWVKARLADFKLEAGVEAMVRRLQAAGYSTGVLTNGHAEVQRSKLEACAAAALFESHKIVVAGDYAQQKPHASIFATACAALGEPPGATVMVSRSVTSLSMQCSRTRRATHSSPAAGGRQLRG